MKSLQRMLDSIEYIESHLDNELLLDEIAAVACMSRFHFQRMFRMLTGYAVSEYIRNRRITVAAQELVHSKSKVIDVAMKYGYESPESFTKAFRRIHGISPSDAKKHSQSLKAYPKISFQIQLKGDVEMDYKIVEKDAFTVVGKSIRTTTIGGENNRKIAAFWNESNRNGLSKQLAKNCGPLGLLGICIDFDKQQENLTYLIAAEKNSDQIPVDWETREIPAATWAIFPVHGAMPNAMPKVWERIFSEWFPATGYEHSGGPEMEVYVSDADPYSKDYYSEIWVPVKK
ncbi:AraC family transcriptional regulator [Shouchella clausii]|uniref:AraC family transcriptional regulator n=1 Tax=Shouchella TaxID=2893057 RepID=UPI0004E7347E|nr:MULTISPECIES: AraC family transcriptional regulator [Shouchella]ALA50845.1 Transcriptional regulator, AraC family [Shouchella clausii]MBU3231655.1 AraC family transcriptional regulator [Shouchella clausii]MBU3265061.1 AraC family transcriptional regulator [Shouchella clausii]MBU3507476.1 AraC family transcriptional regulator [Shouchella clausii]MBU3536008.1 AraC family transcriptional regulator [Shouchella clausii]